MPNRSLALVALAALLIGAARSTAQSPCNGEWRYGPGPGTPGPNGDVLGTTTWDPDGAGPLPQLLIVSGNFTAAGQSAANSIAAWNGTGWQPMGSGVTSGTFAGIVYALATYNGELIAAGLFPTAGGTPANNIARWNASAWQPLSTGTNGYIYALSVYNGELVAGGSFTTAGGVSASRIARWNGSTWQALSTGMNNAIGNPAVTALTVYSGELVAGGGFDTAGAVTANSIARWNGSSWHALGGGVFGGNGGVRTLTVYNTELIAGGGFAAAGSVSASCIARWNGSIWQTLGSGAAAGPGSGPTVSILAVYNAQLVAGGYFDSMSGVAAGNIAGWTGSAWQPMGSGVDFPGVRALTIYNPELIAGGGFSMAGGQPAAHVARWACACYANCDHSTTPPTLNVNDFSCFLNKFAAGDPYANCDGSTLPPVLNILDFGCFLNQFASGCP